jgi:hypothetical protein
MGSWLIGSIFQGTQGLFGLSRVSQAKNVSVNGIIPLVELVCLGPKVILLSGAHGMVSDYNKQMITLS